MNVLGEIKYSIHITMNTAFIVELLYICTFWTIRLLLPAREMYFGRRSIEVLNWRTLEGGEDKEQTVVLRWEFYIYVPRHNLYLWLYGFILER